MNTFTATENQRVSQWIELVTVQCCECAVLFAMPKSLNDEALSKKIGRSFYCPNGHSQHYLGLSDTELLREERERTTRLRETLRVVEKERDHHWTERKKSNTRLRHVKARVKNGVCPCCHRTFSNLARHMAFKHPKFG